MGLDFLDFVVLVLAFALWILISRLHAKQDPREWLAKCKIAVRWVILLAMVLAVVLFGIYGGLDTGSFVYQGF